MTNYRHLDKSEELSHGIKVQNMLGAQDELTLLDELQSGVETYKGINLVSMEDSSKENNESIYSMEFARVCVIKKPGVKTDNEKISVSGGNPGSTEKLLYLNNSTQRRAFLARMIRQGKRSTDVLAKANLGLVYNQAKNFKKSYPSAPDLEDLVQEGMVGLVTAIFKYDPSRGNKLSTVATPWIYQAIARGTNKTGRLVKLPENRSTDYSDMVEIMKRHEEDGLSTAEIHEIIMEELSLSKDDILSISNAASLPLSLNYKVSGDGEEDSPELIDIIGEINASNSSEASVVNTEITKTLGTAFDSLDEIEKDIVSATFGLSLNESGKRVTAKEVREKHDISLQKLKKILDSALTKMKSEMKDNGVGYSDFDDIF